MKNVLLPTDFSENSINAIKYAFSFFKDSEVNFFVLNVQKTSDYTTSDLMSSSSNTTVYRAILDDNKKELNKLISSLKIDNASEKFGFKALVDFDVFTDAIQQAVKSNKIDLIIMGTNGATGAKEVIFGSNTLNVIRHSKCPLIAVPEGFSFKKIKSVLFSINNQNKFTKTGIEPLKEILIRFKSKLKILEIKEEGVVLIGQEAKESIEKIFTDFEFSYHTLNGIQASEAIEAFEQLFPTDLHAIFVEKESFLDRMIFGSETSKISYSSRVPLLILRQ
jgi:nucleotide-binding universal stress UspA family protein